MLFKDRTRKTEAEKQNSTISLSTEETRGNTAVLTEQQPFPDTGKAAAVPAESQAPLVPAPLDSSMMPGTTLKHTEPVLRAPIVIPGTGMKSAGIIGAPKGRRAVVHAGVAVVLVVVVLGALAAVLPTANGQAFGLNKIFTPSSSETVSKQNNTALIASQAATATAVTQDGYDPGNVSYAGVQQNTVAVQNVTPTQPSVPIGPVSGNADSSGRFYVGQCTYWANIHYHNLTGWWVEWLGNADAWVAGAYANNWMVSSEPNPNGPSIIVLQPYTQGAGAYGHVAVVESGVSAASANANGVNTSNMNWSGNGGGWDTVSYWTFHPGSGVSFIWHP